MHMADALTSPEVGGALWAATAVVTAYSVKKVRQEGADDRVPLMGVLGAFVFAAQMINFTIPGTGSSGHLGGGLLLAALLGPAAGFLTMAAILTIQALFFADGGLLALGCNIFNLGFYTCFVTYPLIYQPLVRRKLTKGRIMVGSLLAAVCGLQLGSLSVVLETLFSGLSDLPFRTFFLLMQPIHLAIGLVEGLVTAAVLNFIFQARPELLETGKPLAQHRILRPVLTGFIVVALLVGGVLAWFASAQPDGLEWSLLQATGEEAVFNNSAVHRWFAALQERLAFLPDYNFKRKNTVPEQVSSNLVDLGTSAAGIAGVGLTLGMLLLTGFGLRRAAHRPRN
ncbi:MAG TPA: energy-coupling factor ABC transporter permease [Bacillota bacterium]